VKDYSDFIIKELQSSGQIYKAGSSSKSWIRIKCFSGKHVDKNPSLGVCRHGDGNVPAKCLVCGFITSWNGRKNHPGIADHLGLKHIDGKRRRPGDPDFDTEQELANLEKEYEVLQSNSDKELKSVTLPPLLDLWEGDYVRNGKIMLRSKLLSKIPTYRWYDRGREDKYDLVERIMWPITIDGIIYGYTGRRLDDDKFLRYNSSDDLPSPKLLFPYDYFKSVETVVLVEGPTDALRLLNYGIPALAILGTGTWSKYKRTLLIRKGVKNVILCFDGDKAGRLCTAKVSKDLDKYFNVIYDFTKRSSTDF
jgi:5S rRNA maturation endonuclease (ribonuclease M5)